MLNSNKIKFVYSIVIVFFIASFSTHRACAQSTEDMDIAVVVEASNKFMLKLYGNLKEREENLFFSPYSVSSALVICYFGAHGQTEIQMRDVLSFKIGEEQIPIIKERLYPLLTTLRRKVDSLESNDGFHLNIATSLWAQKSYKFLNAFIEFANKYYPGSFNLVDFLNNNEEARKEINSWVRDHTKNRIAELVPIGILSNLSRLVLINTIYFDAEWQHPFRPNYTKNDAFWLSNKQSINVPMMHQKNNFRYMENLYLKAIELPYIESKVSMIIILPTGKDDLPDIENKLYNKNLDLWLSELTEKNVSLSIPKFKINSELDLAYNLSAIGINDAFNPDNADFSNLDGSKQLYISNVIHKSFIDVDEYKTEVASAIAVAIAKSHAPFGVPVEFRADRPFIFLIRHNETGLILFIGRILNPA